MQLFLLIKVHVDRHYDFVHGLPLRVVELETFGNFHQVLSEVQPLDVLQHSLLLADPVLFLEQSLHEIRSYSLIEALGLDLVHDQKQQ